MLEALPEDWHVVQLHVWMGLGDGGSVRLLDVMRKKLMSGALVRCSVSAGLGNRPMMMQ